MSAGFLDVHVLSLIATSLTLSILRLIYSLRGSLVYLFENKGSYFAYHVGQATSGQWGYNSASSR